MKRKYAYSTSLVYILHKLLTFYLIEKLLPQLHSRNSPDLLLGALAFRPKNNSGDGGACYPGQSFSVHDEHQKHESPDAFKIQQQ